MPLLKAQAFYSALSSVSLLSLDYIMGGSAILRPPRFLGLSSSFDLPIDSLCDHMQPHLLATGAGSKLDRDQWNDPDAR